MFINLCFIFGYLIKFAITTEAGAKKINIRGRQVEHAQKPIHQYDFRKYYKDLFQSIDIHPHFYGNNATKVNKKNVRENFNDDIEHDKHTLIFNQVYKVYKKMLDRRKAELNKTSRVDKAKSKFNAHVNKLEEALRRKLSRTDYMNHKQIIKERKSERKEDKTRSLNPNLNESKNIIHNENKDPSKIIDVSKVKDILNDVENYVHNKIGIPIQTKVDDTKNINNEQADENDAIAPKRAIRNDAKDDLKGKIKDFFGFNKGNNKKFSNKPSRPKTTKTTTKRPTTPDLIEWALNHTNDIDSSEEVKKKGKFCFP